MRSKVRLELTIADEPRLNPFEPLFPLWKAVEATEALEIGKSSWFEEKQALWRESDEARLKTARIGGRVKELETQFQHAESREEESSLSLSVLRGELARSEASGEELRSRVAMLEKKLAASTRERGEQESSMIESYEKQLRESRWRMITHYDNPTTLLFSYGHRDIMTILVGTD